MLRASQIFSRWVPSWKTLSNLIEEVIRMARNTRVSLTEVSHDVFALHQKYSACVTRMSLAEIKREPCECKTPRQIDNVSSKHLTFSNRQESRTSGQECSHSARVWARNASSRKRLRGQVAPKASRIRVQPKQSHQTNQSTPRQRNHTTSTAQPGLTLLGILPMRTDPPVGPNRHP